MAILRRRLVGRTDRQLAATLSMSHDTARKLVANIQAKIDVGTRTAAVTAAVRLGLMSAFPPSGHTKS